MALRLIAQRFLGAVHTGLPRAATATARRTFSSNHERPNPVAALSHPLTTEHTQIIAALNGAGVDVASPGICLEQVMCAAILEACQQNQPLLLPNSSGYVRIGLFPGTHHETYETVVPGKSKYGNIIRLTTGLGGFTPISDPRQSWQSMLFSPQSHEQLESLTEQAFKIDNGADPVPNPLFFQPPELNTGKFLEPGTVTPLFKSGPISVSRVSINEFDPDTSFRSNAEIAILPLYGELNVVSQQGLSRLSPRQLQIVPPGLIHQYRPSDGSVEFLLLKNETHAHFQRPHGGPLGQSLLLQPHSIKTTAPWVDFRGIANPQPHTVITDINGHLSSGVWDQTPYCHIGRSGNLNTWVVDMGDFLPVVSASEDHAHPSTRTLLAIPADSDGRNVVEIVPFGSRKESTASVNEETSRLPYRHEQANKYEFMGYYGGYEAKGDVQAGSLSLNMVLGQHGPKVKIFDIDRNHDGSPTNMPKVTAFMIEGTQYPDTILNPNWLRSADTKYLKDFQTSERYFNYPNNQ